MLLVRIANAITSGDCELLRWLVVGLPRERLSQCSNEIQFSLFAKTMWGGNSKAVCGRARTVVEPVESRYGTMDAVVGIRQENTCSP